MKQSNGANFAKWALVGLVAGIGFSGLSLSVAQSKSKVSIAAQQASLTGGLQVNGHLVASDVPKLHLKVDIYNPGPDSKTVDATVSLKKTQFSGNPMSRTVSPSDIKVTVLEAYPIRGEVPAGKIKSFDVTFHAGIPGAPTLTNRSSLNFEIKAADWKVASVVSIPVAAPVPPVIQKV